MVMHPHPIPLTQFSNEQLTLRRTLRASVALNEATKMLTAHSSQLTTPDGLRPLLCSAMLLILGRLLEAEPHLSASDVLDVFFNAIPRKDPDHA